MIGGRADAGGVEIVVATRTADACLADAGDLAFRADAGYHGAAICALLSPPPVRVLIPAAGVCERKDWRTPCLQYVALRL